MNWSSADNAVSSATVVYLRPVSLVIPTALKAEAEILGLAREWQPSIVAIDSPPGFPKGMCCP